MALAQFEGPEDSNQTKGLGTLLSKENVDVEASKNFFCTVSNFILRLLSHFNY